MKKRHTEEQIIRILQEAQSVSKRDPKKYNCAFPPSVSS